MNIYLFIYKQYSWLKCLKCIDKIFLHYVIQCIKKMYKLNIILNNTYISIILKYIYRYFLVPFFLTINLISLIKIFCFAKWMI